MNREQLRQRIGTWGVDTFRTSILSPAESATLARGLDEQGWPALWIPEIGRTEALSEAGHLLANSRRLIVANAIARIGDRAPASAAAAHAYLQGAHDGRHVLGLGLGPLARQPGPMKVVHDWLDGFDQADQAFGGEATTMLAAYGPQMVRLGGQRSLGSMTYLVTPEHTATSRDLLGPDPVLVAEQAVVITEDQAEARSIAQAHVAPYLGSGPHERKFAALGFGPDDWSGRYSDCLLDALVAWGTIEQCVARLHPAPGCRRRPRGLPDPGHRDPRRGPRRLRQTGRGARHQLLIGPGRARQTRPRGSDGRLWRPKTPELGLDIDGGQRHQCRDPRGPADATTLEISHCQDPVTDHAELIEFHRLDQLADHRLHRMVPELRDPHDDCLSQCCRRPAR